MSFPLSRLRSHIGQRLDYGGKDCVIIDILEDGPQLVLQVSGQSSIQADQWGEAHRRTPESFAVPVYESDGDALNPMLAALFRGE